jgi:hypothetical protein
MRTTSSECADSQALIPFWASLFLPPPPLLAVLTTLTQSVYPLVTDPPNPPAGCRVDNCPAATLPRRTWTESIAIRMRRRGSALWSRRPERPPDSRAARRRHVDNRGHQLWVVGWVSLGICLQSGRTDLDRPATTLSGVATHERGSISRVVNLVASKPEGLRCRFVVPHDGKGGQGRSKGGESGSGW